MHAENNNYPCQIVCIFKKSCLILIRYVLLGVADILVVINSNSSFFQFMTMKGGQEKSMVSAFTVSRECFLYEIHRGNETYDSGQMSKSHEDGVCINAIKVLFRIHNGSGTTVTPIIFQVINLILHR